MNDLYQEIILDHASAPRNFGALKHATHTIKEANASCGDMLELQLKVENGKIVEVGWRGVGCAISTASCSMVSEMLLGKTVKEAKKLTKKEVMDAMGMDEILPTREKCLQLPLRAVEKI